MSAIGQEASVQEETTWVEHNNREVNLNVVKESHNDVEKNVELSSLSDLTGFPVEFIKKELLISESDDSKEISLNELRNKMLKYLDKTMME